MHPIAAILGVAILLVGCIAQPVKLATGVYDCSAPAGTLQGLLVRDLSGTALFSHMSSDHTTALMWPAGYTAVEPAEGEVEVRDAAGARVATTGKSYSVEYGRSDGDSRLFPVCRVTEIDSP